MRVPRIPAGMFAFTTGDRAELSTAVLYAFADANERLETSLGFDEVRDRLRAVGYYDAVTEDELGARLHQLVRWQLLDMVQDHGAHYATAEEYERKNLRYSLTKQGEAAVEGVQHALVVLTSTGALQTAVLEAIADRLNELYELQVDAASSDRTLFNRLTELETHLEALRSNTRQFNNELARLLRDDAADIATFHEVKTATIAYLHEFVSNLDQRVRTIADAVGRVEETGVAVLHQRALAGAELPALATAGVEQWLAHRGARWDGLRLWFRPAGGTPRIDDLRDIARRAIVTLMRTLDRISESRRRSSSVAADFRTLARWFAAVPSEDGAHRLWNAAFGLWPARHAHLAHEDADTVPTSTAWPEAPAVPLSPLLRTHGRSEHVGRTAKVRDVGAVRALRRAQAHRERVELDAAWRQLATHGPVRVSDLRALDHESFERLLDLVGRALAARPDTTGVRRAAGADGRVEIVLGLPVDGRRATLRTPRGRFTGPDYLVDIAHTDEHADQVERREARS